jgi:hypothetical protein
MAGQAQRIADLEDRVASLAAELERYHQEACIVRSLEDVTGYRMTTASMTASAQQQPRHLHAVPDPEPESELEAGA